MTTAARRSRTIAAAHEAGQNLDVEPCDSGLAFVRCAGVSEFDLDLNEWIDPANNGAGCYIIAGRPAQASTT